MGSPRRLMRSRMTARFVRNAPTPPQAGARSTEHSNGVIEIDLFFVDEQTFRVIVGIHVRWARVVKAPSRQGETLFKRLMAAWIRPSGAPREITMGAGGEIYGEFQALRQGVLGNHPGFRPRGSRASLGEERNHVFKDTTVRAKEPRRERERNIILSHV